MEITTISAFSAILGSVVGGSATVAIGWITQKTLNKRELVRIEMRSRQML
jgi:membrane protein YqaA with SNARE-associated domain